MIIQVFEGDGVDHAKQTWRALPRGIVIVGGFQYQYRFEKRDHTASHGYIEQFLTVHSVTQVSDADDYDYDLIRTWTPGKDLRDDRRYTRPVFNQHALVSHFIFQDLQYRDIEDLIRSVRK